MKKIISIFTIFVFLFAISNAQAQYQPFYTPPELPPGNYMDSCGSSGTSPWEGTTLVLFCGTNYGWTVVTSQLANASNCKYVENINGVLTCTGGWK